VQIVLCLAARLRSAPNPRCRQTGSQQQQCCGFGHGRNGGEDEVVELKQLISLRSDDDEQLVDRAGKTGIGADDERGRAAGHVQKRLRLEPGDQPDEVDSIGQRESECRVVERVKCEQAATDSRDGNRVARTNGIGPANDKPEVGFPARVEKPH
jgi:hypothetical protein